MLERWNDNESEAQALDDPATYCLTGFRTEDPWPPTTLRWPRSRATASWLVHLRRGPDGATANRINTAWLVLRIFANLTATQPPLFSQKAQESCLTLANRDRVFKARLRRWSSADQNPS